MILQDDMQPVNILVEKLGALKDVAEGAAALAGKDQIVKSAFGT